MTDFPEATLEMWQARAGDAAGLAGHTRDGIAVASLYQQIQGPRTDRGFHGPWHVLQRVDHPDAMKANAQILDDLQNGADGLVIARDFDARLMQDVALHAIHIRLEGDAGLATAFANFVRQQPIDPARLHVSFGLAGAEQVDELVAQGFTGPFINADGRRHHNQGATEAEELACVLSAVVNALRSLDATAPSVTLAANQDMFLTLAKFRAIRLLWSRILEASGLPQRPLQVHGETSLRMMATLDPHTNLLRATAAVFGAGLGGCDSFTVLPFSIKQGLPNAFARRMARNTQAVLLEESQLWRVADAASGAGYVESLTRDLCERAWAIFQGIEASGKLPAFDASNASSAPIIGTSVHQLPQEFEAAIELLP
jgi:methylmalonyl-CoA mutase